jgi:hypothetical protein
MALGVELDTFNPNFFGFDQRIRALAGLAQSSRRLLTLMLYRFEKKPSRS